MSERRKVESTLRDASFKIENAISHLHEAKRYLDSYEFLKDSKPGLYDELDSFISILDGIAFELWDCDVQT